MTDTDTVRDLRRELEKARHALIDAQTHLAAHAEANAALHCATTVMYSPLHAKVTAAIGQAEHALLRTESALTEPALTDEQRPHIPGSELADHYGAQVRQQRADTRTELAALQHRYDDEHATAVERAHETARVRGQLAKAEAERGTYRAAWHSAKDRARKQHARAEQAGAERDGAYRERAQLLAWLAAQHPAVLVPAPDVDEPGWQILYLNAGGQQLSWHVHPRDADLYGHVEQAAAGDPRAQWDGHSTAEKYQRIAVLTQQRPGCPDPVECGHEAALGQAEARIAAVGKGIAYRIRAELVCCDVYGRVNDRPGVSDAGRTVLFKDERDRPGFHDICYWGEAAARLAEDRPDGAPAGVAPVPEPCCPYDYHDMPDEVCMCQPHGAGDAHGCPEGCPTHNPGGPDVPEGAIGGPDTDGPTGQPACCVCGSTQVVYRNYRERPFCGPCTDPSELHARRAHPGWEYATTEGPRKQWDDAGTPPYDDNGDPDPSWERNVDAGRDGWERFDYTEESYWRRPRPAEGAS